MKESAKDVFDAFQKRTCLFARNRENGIRESLCGQTYNMTILIQDRSWRVYSKPRVPPQPGFPYCYECLYQYKQRNGGE